MARPRKQPELVLIPDSLDRPEFIEAWQGYWAWRTQTPPPEPKLRVRDVDGMQRDWLAMCGVYGVAASIAALMHTRGNRYLGLTPAPRALVEAVERRLAGSAQPACTVDAAPLQAAVKAALRDDAEGYLAHLGVTYDLAQTVQRLEDLPTGARQPVRAAARRIGYRL